jgi:hypothetical protein
MLLMAKKGVQKIPEYGNEVQGKIIIIIKRIKGNFPKK